MKFLGILIVAFGLLACGESRSESNPPSPPSPDLWRILEGASAPRQAGPYTYITRRPVVMADGTEIVCATTRSGTALWCKKVEDGS